MTDRPFQFELYRLQTLLRQNLFNMDSPSIGSDEDILKVISHCAGKQFDRTRETGRTNYLWSVRDFNLYEIQKPSRAIAAITLARSIVTQVGLTVTDSGVDTEARSESSPPLATPLQIFFDMNRHLVAVEYNSTIMASDFWRSVLHEIFDAAAADLNFKATLRIEPVPEAAEVINAFTSFSQLTRLRVTLRLPNPELSRFTAKLKKEMEIGKIREYKQDMWNPEGLSQGENGLPFASAAMAQDGYKTGDVLLEGIVDGKRKTIRTGRHAVRGKIDNFREMVRKSAGLPITVSSYAIESIAIEIDHLAPRPTDDDGLADDQ